MVPTLILLSSRLSYQDMDLLPDSSLLSYNALITKLQKYRTSWDESRRQNILHAGLCWPATYFTIQCIHIC